MLGGYWSIGALRAIEEVTGWDARRADVVVGTSVGAVLSALLTAGVRVPDLVEDQYGKATDGPLAHVRFDHDSAWVSHPRLLPLGSGSPELLVRSLLNPLRPSLLEWCTALFPAGVGSLRRVHELVEQVCSDGAWPSTLRIVATDYATGQRRSFASPDRYQVGVADAVAASCAMPGYFSPISIDGRRYVDGAVTSVTNTDVLLGSELDAVSVLAPMAAVSFDRPSSASGLLERAARVSFNRALRREKQVIESSGTTVRILAPSAEDLAVMGANLMDPGRRIDVLETARVTTRRQLLGG